MIRLLIVIYIAFIGLGIPDSLIGSAWPAIYPEFDLPVSYISFITLLISGCTVLSGLFSDRVLQRFGTGIVTAVSTALTAAKTHRGKDSTSDRKYKMAFASKA